MKYNIVRNLKKFTVQTCGTRCVFEPENDFDLHFLHKYFLKIFFTKMHIFKIPMSRKFRKNYVNNITYCISVLGQQIISNFI